ncbi:alpha/beta-hydrolase [Rostrohypoxylon terebratum]|nr:alpha/beta-hydrolase [Rostrohypoxylon terebratum]
MSQNEIIPETICLPHKPHSPLSYQFVPGQGPQATSHLVVFLNGLVLPQDGWMPTIRDLQRRWSEKGRSADGGGGHPALLTYDRYGQGASARDPADGARDDGTHDVREVVSDLHELARCIWRAKVPSRDQGEHMMPSLVFVANSIGCVIARLYAASFARGVDALLLLDSNIANSDLVSVFPDPDAPGFDPATLPRDVAVAELRRVREAYTARFHPSVPNPEHLDRRDIADLLPAADAPKLLAAGDQGPVLTVVGHDWDTFAREGLQGPMRVPESLTNQYMNPAWSRYNEGLVHITDAARTRGPVTAVGCGHFIQRDDPVLVAELIDDLLARVRD